MGEHQSLDLALAADLIHLPGEPAGVWTAPPMRGACSRFDTLMSRRYALLHENHDQHRR